MNAKLKSITIKPVTVMLLAIFIFALLAVALLNKSLLPSYTLVPLRIIQDIAPWDHLVLGPRGNRLIIDPFFVFYPNRAFLTQALQNGQFPLWNPYLFAGTPTMADPNFQPFYLPNLLLALVLSADQAIPWGVFFHLTLAGSFMFLFLRRHRLHWLACVLGGGIWLLNGYGLVWLENPHRWSTAAWIAGVFWAYEAATQERKAGWAALGGLFLGMAILGGQAQFIFVIGLMFGLYGLVKMGYTTVQERHFPTRPLLYLILIGIVGLGLGALILLPASQFAQYSGRELSNAANILDTRWPLTHLITLIAPDFYGNPATDAVYWGAYNFAEATAYFGVVALLLALIAPWVGRRPFLIYALVLGTAALAITLGTPAARTLLLLPGSQFVVLVRTIFLIPFAGAWLAAAGLDGWLLSDVSNRQRIIPLVISVAALVIVSGGVIAALGDAFGEHQTTALADVQRGVLLVIVTAVLLLLVKRWPRTAASLLVILAFADLWQWGHSFNPIHSAEYLYPHNNVIEQLAQDEELFRVLPLQHEKLIFGPNILPLYQMSDITGYSSLIKQDYYQMIEAMDNDVTIGWIAANPNILVMSHFHPLTGLLNVKYILSAVELHDPALIFVNFLDGIWIYENPTALPRAFLTHHVQNVDEGQAISTLLNGELDWRQTAVIETPLPVELSRQLSSSPIPAQGQATITRYGLNQVDVVVDTAVPGLLVLSDTFYPGWQATVDGTPAEIFEVDGAFRGLFIPAGQHQITFQFRPQVMHIGIILAVLSLVLAAGMITIPGLLTK
ncbi:MAG: YfhO family protein [Chloroflexi bacterium]|nr:YfhO family protein [Chloroflexota bacterium]